MPLSLEDYRDIYRHLRTRLRESGREDLDPTFRTLTVTHQEKADGVVHRN